MKHHEFSVLSEREHLILMTTIEDFIEENHPIGSQYLKKRHLFLRFLVLYGVSGGANIIEMFAKQYSRHLQPQMHIFVIVYPVFRSYEHLVYVHMYLKT